MNRTSTPQGKSLFSRTPMLKGHAPQVTGKSTVKKSKSGKKSGSFPAAVG